MTGRELILYILQNHLEDEVVIANDMFIGYMTIEEAAVKFKVGTATVRAWMNEGMIPGIRISENVLIPVTAERPSVR